MMMRTLTMGDPIEVLCGDKWTAAVCASVGFSDIVAELVHGGSVMIPRTEPKHWRFRDDYAADRVLSKAALGFL